MHNGYTDLPPGKIAAIVTYLEMREPPLLTGPAGGEFAIRQVERPDLEWYRKLYRRIGEPWLWFSRLRLSDKELASVIHDGEIDVIALSYEGTDQGLLELDRRQFPDIEVSFFGVVPELIGKGAGRSLLQHGLTAAWRHNPQRIWLHTCTADHPRALEFYIKAGFRPFKRAIEIADDPRVTGDMPTTAAPHIPIL